MTTVAYKVFTHDLCSPIRGGEPVWDGTLPYTLPTVGVDTSDNVCGAGWNACLNATDALNIAGLWPEGHPSRLFKVETERKAYERDNKVRAASWTIVEEITDLEPVVFKLHKQFMGLQKALTKETMEWRRALTRPQDDRKKVVQGLREALDARGLHDWKLKDLADDDDLAPKKAARIYGPQWDALQEAWLEQYITALYDKTKGKFSLRAFLNAWSSGSGFESWSTVHAKAALLIQKRALNGETDLDPNILIVGIRDAFLNGLGFALPITIQGYEHEKVLGWIMETDR